MTADADVLVVGAGPVGLAAAIEARLAGLSAIVIEPRKDPIDKACGEGLMPGAVRALERIGVRPAGRAFDGIGYRTPLVTVDHTFRHGHGLGVRRLALQDAMAVRAAELGVERVDGRVDELTQDADGVTAAGIRSRWLIGADGLHSTVRGLAGLAVTGRARKRFGLRRHFAVAPWSDLVEVHWTPQAEVYVTPVADDLVGVAVLGPAHMDYAAVVASVAELAWQLDSADAVTTVRGAGPMRQSSKRRTAGRVLLVGDASGYVDAITGEGIRLGLDHARLAIASIAEGSPQLYEGRWRSATRDVRMLTAGLAALGNSPARGSIVPAARRLPGVFSTVVERIAR